MVGSDRDPDIQKVEAFLSRNRIPFQSFDLDSRDDEAVALCKRVGHKPAVILDHDRKIEHPTPRKVARELNMSLDIPHELRTDVLIVGGGPAGVSAAVNAGAEGLSTLVLPLRGLKRLENAGVFYAATETEARFCRNTDGVVVGGGNSAGQAAMYLSRVARHIHILVRGDNLSDTMSSYLVQRLQAQSNIKIRFGTEVTALHGGDHLERVTVRSRGEENILPARALFLMIGAPPNTEWLSNLMELDSRGFVKTGKTVGAERPFETSRQGIFAIGDVRAGSVKRVASAAGEGSVVVPGIYEFLATHDVTGA